MKNRIVVLISAVWLVLSMTAYSQDEKGAPTFELNQKAEAPQAPKRLYAALFVIDSMDCASEKQLDTFRSIVSSRMAQTGFSVINQDVVIEALRKEGLSLSPDTLGAITREGTALSLSELMGADYLIIARLLGYQTQRKSYSRGQIATEMDIHKLHVGYEVLTGDNGSSFMSGAISPQKVERTTENLVVYDSDRMLELMGEAADQISLEIQGKLNELKVAQAVPVPERVLMPFTVNCVIADLSLAPLTMPLFWVNNDGTLGTPEKGVKNLSLYADGAIVELDGVMIGTTPGTFEARPGVHKLTISREGNKPVVKTVNIKKQSSNPQEFNIAVSPTEAELQKLKEGILFFQKLLERNQRREIELARESAITDRIRAETDMASRLTDAEAQRIVSYGKMLEQSGYRVDIKANYQGKSPYDGGIMHWYEMNKNTLFK